MRSHRALGGAPASQPRSAEPPQPGTAVTATLSRAPRSGALTPGPLAPSRHRTVTVSSHAPGCADSGPLPARKVPGVCHGRRSGTGLLRLRLLTRHSLPRTGRSARPDRCAARRRSRRAGSVSTAAASRTARPQDRVPASAAPVDHLNGSRAAVCQPDDADEPRFLGTVTLNVGPLRLGRPSHPLSQSPIACSSRYQRDLGQPATVELLLLLVAAHRVDVSRGARRLPQPDRAIGWQLSWCSEVCHLSSRSGRCLLSFSGVRHSPKEEHGRPATRSRRRGWPRVSCHSARTHATSLRPAAYTRC
jgi:hypothetical protein